MDEPCTALDLISTLKTEETMDELKKNFTIIIVAHKIKQARKVIYMTRFFNFVKYDHGESRKVGYLAEYRSTSKIFNSPKQKTSQEYMSNKFR